MRLHLTADPGSQERVGYASDARDGLEVPDILGKSTSSEESIRLLQPCHQWETLYTTPDHHADTSSYLVQLTALAFDTVDASIRMVYRQHQPNLLLDVRGVYLTCWKSQEHGKPDFKVPFMQENMQALR